MNLIEKDIVPNQIVVCNDRYGQGKGWALREALKEAKGDKIIFIDGDGDISPQEINKVLIYLSQYDVVVGKKALPSRWDRKLLTFLSRFYIRLMFGFEEDSQTGLKGFNYKPSWTCDGFAFDIEILWKAKKMEKSIIEIPIRAIVSDTKSLKTIWRTLWESLVIRFRS
jgi:cellulose synthase/poly-beta-1,6-N-acetylglucosamine synthase-like glycosyltransferase